MIATPTSFMIDGWRIIICVQVSSVRSRRIDVVFVFSCGEMIGCKARGPDVMIAVILDQI
jgi:hypothetical protein